MNQYIGKMLDNRYEILELIGSGGMANVYKAKCHRLNRMVAVKILKNDLAENADFLLTLVDENESVPSLTRRRCLCQLVEALSRVAPDNDAAYCLDRYREIPTTEMRIIGDDLVPEDVLQQTSEPQRWRRNIVHMCLQEDSIVVSTL